MSHQDGGRETGPTVIPAQAVDELARELFIADNFKQPREQSMEDWRHFEAANKYYRGTEHYKAMAAHVLAIGYRKPADAV